MFRSEEVQLIVHQKWLNRLSSVFFMDNRFKVEEMSLMLNVSKRTVERKLHAYGLSQRNCTVITDYQLDEVVSQVCVLPYMWREDDEK